MATAARPRQSASFACSDFNRNVEMAVGYWYTEWARQRCLHAFDEESLRADVQDTELQDQCDVTLYRPAGDLRVRIADGNVVKSWARPDRNADWLPVNRSVCLLSSVAGATPWLEPVNASLVRFAYNALVAFRARAQPFRLCGTPGSGQRLSLVSSSGLNAVVQVTERRVEWTFFLEVLEGGTSVPIPVRVRVEAWPGAAEQNYRMVSSTPEACEISSAMPYAAFGCTGSSPAGARLLSSFVHSGPLLASNCGNTDKGTTSANARAALGVRSLERTESMMEPVHPTRRLARGNLTAMPDRYDFRRQFPQCVQSIQSSGHCGASWAFAGVGAFEKQLCRLSGARLPEPLSRQRVIDCATWGSCEGGSVFDAYGSMLAAGSVMAASCAPYGTPSGCAAATCGSYTQARFPEPKERVYQTRLRSAMPGLWAANVLMGEQAMQQALLLYGAVTSSFLVLPDFLSYAGGVYQGRGQQPRLGTHVVTVIGWGLDGKRYWVAENSWGAAWGENQDYVRCSVIDCRFGSCSSEVNNNMNCMDSDVWRDAYNQSCGWYTNNDRGCRIYPDAGQMSACRLSCQNCLPPPVSVGEQCGYFRMLRGVNHLGIESFSTHSYVQGFSSQGLSGLSRTCLDALDWRDPWSQNCSWYAVNDPGCLTYADYGQRSFCRMSCRTCPFDMASNPGEQLPSCALSIQAAVALAMTLAWPCIRMLCLH